MIRLFYVLFSDYTYIVNINRAMASSQRQQRKTDSKHSSSDVVKAKSTSNSNVLILGIAFAALILYVLYQSISVYNKDRMYNDFD
jgi:hypothetical protein